MQLRPSFFALALATFALAAACGDSTDPSAEGDDDDDDDDDDDAPSASSSGGGGSSSSSGGTGSSSSSSGGSSSSSGGPDASTIPEKPADCIVLETGTFANGPDLTPRQYGAQPTFRGVVVSPEGDPELGDLLHVRIDASTGLGSYELTFPETDFNCYGNGAQCVYLAEDVAAGVTNRFYAATRGRIRIDAQITTDQSQGVLEYVELREAFLESHNVPYNQATPIQDGKCLWIENAAFDTRRADGCNPMADAPCPNDQACIRENAAGTDGTCHGGTGGGTNGTPCSQDANGDSNCGLEYMCSEETNPASRKCRKLCKLLGAGNVCPTGTFCGFFGYCEPPTSLVDETVAAGAACDPDQPFCGVDGARGGCFNATDQQNQPLPEGPLCHALEASRAACPAGQELGYYTFEGYDDRSIGACVPRND